ncbi:hypothetical protein AMS68_001394 [Peltaster fructicola]|uniref:Dynactin subunit n=1 Tax=Peltaster fructicola TaxID=286661 RepID=A0A6H0XM97_9PEZI|nr:hypothetical protein AMS68_001394 [Peltaster fructicola]
MAEAARLTKLPGYDTAPDVYETPEITSESPYATNATEASISGSSSGTDTADSDEDGPFGGISRRRLFPERARSRFQAVGNRVDTKGLDLSDRVDGRRRGIGVRQRRAGQQTGEDETLEARIARLRKEVEECRVLAQDGATGSAKHKDDIDGLGRSLALLDSSEDRTKTDTQELQTSNATSEKALETAEPVDEQTLGKIAAFDGRLSALERALGISSMDVDATAAFTAPVLPSLDLMDKQLSALMTATSISQLDASSSRIKKLAREAEQLAQVQATPRSQSESVPDGEDKEATVFSTDDMAKLDALYALLPNLQGLTPMVPALLERLRSLTALHAGAATAADELDDLVKKQADMAAELKSWEQSLVRLEEVVKDASEANGRNGTTVNAWVQDLQKRVEALR